MRAVQRCSTASNLQDRQSSREQLEVLEAQLRPPANSNLAALRRVAPVAKICKRFQTGLGEQRVM